MIKVIITGALGRMGGMVADEIEAASDIELYGAVVSPHLAEAGAIVHGVPVVSSLQDIIDGCDVVVDFTMPEATMEFVAECAAAGKPFITGTTGLTAGQMEAIEEVAGKIPVVVSPNMSAGVNLLFRIVRDVASALPDFDIEISETHHNRKKDSPSGTAAKIAEEIKLVRPGSECVYGREGFVGERTAEEIGMHSLRGGDITGEHSVLFAGKGERFELVHRAHSRKTFACGTMRAIRFISGNAPGLYTMADVLGL